MPHLDAEPRSATGGLTIWERTEGPLEDLECKRIAPWNAFSALLNE